MFILSNTIAEFFLCDSVYINNYAVHNDFFYL
jgi:hypothetical protein